MKQCIECRTNGRGLYDLTIRVQNCLPDDLDSFCQLFVHHTSASLLITENADPVVHKDLERFFARLVPDGDSMFKHTAEGADDMPAHVRSALTQTSLTVPVDRGRLSLGTWQGIYLFEHRLQAHTRRVTVSWVLQHENLSNQPS